MQSITPVEPSTPKLTTVFKIVGFEEAIAADLLESGEQIAKYHKTGVIKEDSPVVIHYNAEANLRKEPDMRKRFDQMVESTLHEMFHAFIDVRLGGNKFIKDFISQNSEEFAKAKAIDVKETSFEKLTDRDKEGHEKYSSKQKMLQTFSKYYNKKITPKTKLKIIKIKLK